MSSLSIDVSGLGVRVRHVPSDLVPILEDAWRGFVVSEVDDPLVEAIVAESDGAALTPARVMVGPMSVRREGGTVRLARDEGEASLDLVSGRMTATLAAGDDGRRAWGLVNLVTAALAWRLAGRGGGILHAAGIVIDGRAFVLIGAEGSGKSTFARVATAAGAGVISDDQVVVARSPRGLEAVGAPVRNRDASTLSRGRWPVAAFLLPRHGTPAAVAPAARLDLAARLAANLLYVSGEGPLDELASGVPALWLTFAPEPSFVDRLRETL